MQAVPSKRGKVAVVTGAARGLGYAFARRLATEGATIVVADIDEARGVADHIKAAGAEAVSVHRVDVSDESEVSGLATAVLSEYGRCDILINNAGVVPYAKFFDISLADWQRVMTVNVQSVFLMCRAFLPSMIGNRYGRVLNLTSEAIGLTLDGFSHYMASKAAIVGLTRALANEFGQSGVTVNCLAPGLIKTERTSAEDPDAVVFNRLAAAQAIKRHGVPDDLVGAMSFLTSDDSAFITGQALIVDGGLVKAL